MMRERPWCRYEGFQKGDALRAYFNSATMLVLPTLEDNCPMVVLEAMAAGLPVAAARIGGVPDLIDHEINGLLFNPQDPDDMRNSVLKLLQRELAERLAAKGRKRALERYHPAEIARRHLEVYHELLNWDEVIHRAPVCT
jgi:glycosyltransferase involved in cell wall biosynthesis